MQSLLSNLQIKKHRTQKPRSLPVVFAAQSNFIKVLQTAWKVGKDGIEAGTSLVPDSVPRPVARISVTVVALTLSLFVLKSFLSTAFFVLATMGLAYFIFIALNKDDRSRGSGGSTSKSTENRGSTATEEALEEARRIMDKYNPSSLLRTNIRRCESPITTYLERFAGHRSSNPSQGTVRSIALGEEQPRFDISRSAILGRTDGFRRLGLVMSPPHVDFLETARATVVQGICESLNNGMGRRCKSLLGQLV
ncbi:hypothetical protein Q3G72_004684 [Acer saccharum]|nr:hypothetical protein Q3G72_004684 [Acer saccharum]